MKLNKTTILTALSIFGTLGVAITTYKATLKADKVLKDEALDTKDKIQRVWKDYIPVAITIGGTVTCIVASHHISRKQIAAIASAASMSGKLVEDYRQAILERYGEEGLDEIHKTMAEKAEPPEIVSYGLCSINKGLPNEGPEMLFFDQFTERWFRSSISAVKEAGYRLNRNFVLRGYASLGEYYEFLGLSDIPDKFETIGWNAYDGYSWVDIHYTLSETDEGEQYYIIWYVFTPQQFEESDYIIDMEATNEIEE